MNTFFKILYYYFLGMLVFFTLYLTVMLAVSPKQDKLKRGFIPCTEKLVHGVFQCERGTIGCPLKNLWRDMQCNTGVILDGIGAWVRGRQNTPWANYLFEPQNTEDEYADDKNVDMDTLEKNRQFIKAKREELEKVKNRSLNLQDDVIMFEPEDVLPNDIKSDIQLPEEDKNMLSGDISEEAFMGKIENMQQSKTEEKTKNEAK